MDILVSIAAKIAEYSVAPIGRSVGYMIYYNRNIKTLHEEANNLGDLKSGVQGSVDTAKRNSEVIKPEVERWLDAVDKLNDEVKTFLEGEVEINKSGWCSYPITCYSLSRKAKKKTRAITKLKGKGSFPTIASPAPPPRKDVMEGFVNFESRKLIMDEIMEALKDDNIKAIGICGLGGVGKTTAVTEVEKRAKVEKLFDEVVVIVVTQTPDLIAIQGEIAERLGLKLEDKNLRVRADRLHAGLLQCKSILVILDDVWEKLELEQIGIPFGGNNGCKLMMTSRNQDVCIAMKTCKLFSIDVLSEQEAWSLFKDKAGDSIDSDGLHQIATKVVKECGGLPMAILTVGTALKGKPKAMWEDALFELGQSSPENISGMNKNVYQSLKLSFDFLESKQAKSCLLLCCIFKEDANIPLQDLVRCGVGLDLFQGTKELVQATNRVYTLVHKLKSCYLLLDSEEEECVKMHDVVRDVIRSIAIAGKEDLVLRHGLELKEWPTESGDELYTSLIYHKIQQLLLSDKKGDMENVPDNLFEGMKELRVLDLRGMFVPSSLLLLTNLRTLCLQDCLMENVSLIGELKMLRVLSFRGSFIWEVPEKIGELIHLQSLDLTNCDHLERIYPGVLSSLIRLEQLYMRHCYNMQWQVDEEGTSERYNTNLVELESLSDHLTTLEIDLPSSAKFWGGFKKLVRFWIYIGNKPLHAFMYMAMRGRNKLFMKLDSGIPLESWINEVLKKTEILDFQVCGVKNVVNNVNQERYEQLKSLQFLRCDMLECVIDKVDLVQQSIFPVLETLYIDDMENLKMICRGQLPAGSFVKLRSIELFNCKRLENVFSESIARGLVQLEELKILHCGMMEEIVVMERGAEEQVITSNIRFPKLGKLEFRGLRSLVGFSKKMGEIEFPQLKRLHLEELPELRSLCPSNSVGNSEGKYEYDESATQHLLNQKIKSLSELRSIEVEDCKKLLNVFSPDLIQSLQNLEEVKIKKCYSVEVALDFMGVKIEEGHAAVPLSMLKKLELIDLHKLICVWKKLPQRILDCQNLQSLQVVWCSRIKYIFSPSTAKIAKQLQELHIIGCEMMTEILAEDEGDENIMDKFEFLQLRHLTLSGLPNIRSFFLKDAGSVENHLFNGKVSFPKLEVLEVSKMKNIGEIWCSQLPTYSFCELRVLKVSYCDKILQVVPFHYLLTRLHNLEEVNVSGCNSLEEVFEFKSRNVEEGHAVMLPGSLQHTSLNSLKNLQVSKCANLRKLFNPSMIRGLVNLQELDITDCLMMEEIVTKGEEQEEGTMDKIVLPQLKRLKLCRLQNLTSFCQGLYTFELSSLDYLRVEDCPKMRTFSLGFASTPKLVGVQVSLCHREVLMGDLNNAIQQCFDTIQQCFQRQQDFEARLLGHERRMKLKETKASNDHETNNNMFGDFEGSLHLEELFADSELEENECGSETSYQAHPYCQDLEVNRETVPQENEAQRDQSPN